MIVQIKRDDLRFVTFVYNQISATSAHVVLVKTKPVDGAPDQDRVPVCHLDILLRV